MPNKSHAIKNIESDDSWTAREKLTDAAGEVKQKVSELGRSATNKIDENRDAAASGLKEAASILDL